MFEEISTMTNHNVSKAMRISCLVTLVVCVYGCVVIPRPFLPSSDTFIEKESLRFIETGQTEKEDLRQAFGPPDWSFDGGSRWIYKTRMYITGGMGVCVGDVISGGGSCSKPRGVAILTILDLDFDSVGIVSRQEISSLEPGSCTESQVCFSPLMIYATADNDAFAKQFLVEPGQCAVYLFTEKSFSPISVRFDEIEVIQRYGGDKGYLLLILDVEKHESDDEFKIVVEHNITVAYDSLGYDYSRSISFDCVAGAINFMREHHDYAENFSFTMVSDDVGRGEVLQRNLVLLPDPK